MLLTLSRWMRRRLRTENPEGGIAIITVIGVMAVAMIAAIAISASAISASSLSTGTRANVQSRAAADAAIDFAYSGFAQGTYYCSIPAAAGIDYSATVEYFDEDGDPLVCVGAAGLVGTPAQAVVTSTGRAEQRGVAGNDSNDERTIIGLFDIEVNPGTVNLDEAVFSDGSTTLQNDVKVVDGTGAGNANIYSNGTVECKTQSAVQGSVYVQGNFTAPNRCVVNGTVWAGGAVTSADQLTVGRDILARGGDGATPQLMDLDKTFAGGSIVSNGEIRLNTSTNTNSCPLAGFSARVCGNLVSIESSIQLSNGARVGGSILARGSIALGSTNNVLIVGGNVVSRTGQLTGSNFGNSGERVRGYVALGGSTTLPKARVGVQASSCAASSSGQGYAACSPAQPVLPLAGLPSELNFPTETRVIAPPRESLPRIESEPTDLVTWAADGWTIEQVACTAVESRITAGWTGKLLLDVQGCTQALNYNNTTTTLTGDLVIMNDTGFSGQNNVVFRSNNSTVRRLMLIVPSDAQRGAGPLVTWTTPIASDPTFTRPVCPNNGDGGLRFSQLTLTNLETFLYSPCEVAVTNTLTGFKGQIYAGEMIFPNNPIIEFIRQPVVGASAPGGATGSIDVEQTARFDVRG